MIYIDLNNYIKRIYHGGGNPYQLMYDLLLKRKHEPMTLVSDTPTSRKARREIFADYKKGRNMGEDPVYFEVLKNCIGMALCYTKNKVLYINDAEADDYLRLNAKKGDIVISNDKDLWPLINKEVEILLNATTKVTRELVGVKFNCIPGHIDLYKTLVGDPSDKIPGKKGFGKAAWNKLTFSDRELYNHHFSIGNCDYDPKMMTEQACMSWKLATPIEPKEIDTCIGAKKDIIAYCGRKGIML